jgi:DinB superfamily
MHSKLTKLRDEISSAIDGMTVDHLTHKPEGKWCAAEILEHLSLTYVGTIKNMQRRLAEGKPSPTGDRAKKSLKRIAVTRFGYIPPGRQSPERAMPRGVPAQQVVGEMVENLARMDGVISECEMKFSRRVAIAEHPILGPLTAREWRAFHFVHGRNHAKQLHRIRRSLLGN